MSLVRGLAAVGIAVLAGCTSAETLVATYADPSPSLERVSVCHGYGCRSMTEVRVGPGTWREVERVFEPRPATAAEERDRIAKAVALLERRIGAAVGHDHDRFAAATFNSDPGQLDCIDETVNTTTYLRLFAKYGLMTHHAEGVAAQRGSITGHFYNDFLSNTAVIVEKTTGAQYAVDSYFFANGQPPIVLPLAVWRDGWRPAHDDPRLMPPNEPPA